MPSDPSLPYQSLVGAFRAQVQRRPLPEAERRLLWALGSLLVFSTWAIGLRDAWAQAVACGMAALCLGLAFVRKVDTGSPDVWARVTPLRRLMTFPIFWLGLLLLAYMAVQTLNPARLFQQDFLAWDLVRIPHLEWLPSGNRTPFQEVPGSTIPHTNGWFYVMLWATPWLAVCAIWAGFTRRLSFQILAWIVVLNAVALALIAVAQRLTQAPGVLWFYEVPGYFWGTFSYRNWAGFFLGLSGAVGLGLALNYARERLFAARGRNPVAMVLLLALVILSAAVLSGSRAAVLWVGVLVVFSLFPAALLVRRMDPGKAVWIPVSLLGVLILGFGVMLVAWLQPKGWPESVARIFRSEDMSTQGRVILNQATFELLEREPWYGVGVGGFRYHFPDIQHRYMQQGPRGPRPFSSFVRDAHNDWLQYRLELGRIGGGLALALLIYWLIQAFRIAFWRSPFALLCGLGVGLACLHAAGEFVWQNGACLLLFGLVIVIGIGWRSIEHDLKGGSQT